MTRPPYPHAVPQQPTHPDGRPYGVPRPRPYMPVHPVRILMWVVAIVLMSLLIINLIVFDATAASFVSWLHQYTQESGCVSVSC